MQTPRESGEKAEEVGERDPGQAEKVSKGTSLSRKILSKEGASEGIKLTN